MTSAAILPSMAGGVLVASPSTSLREQVRKSLQVSDGPIHEVQGGADALAKLESGQWQLLFLDRRLRDLDAEELIQIIKLRFPGIEVVVVDSDTNVPLAGGNAAPGSWLAPGRQAGETAREGSRLPQGPALFAERKVAPLPGMVGDAEVMQRLYRLTRLVAPRLTTVLVTGATGTGKELVARAIHQLSARAHKPWAVVNCAAIPEALLESELFGHVRGAFTGAVQGYAGRIHLAQGGTLFLDEVGELPLSLQAKLLRFLDQKEVQRLGSPGGGAGRCAGGGGYECQLGAIRRAGPLSRRPLLPPIGVSPGSANAGGSKERHSTPRRALSRGNCGGVRLQPSGARWQGGGAARSASLAGKRAGIAAGDGEGIDPGRGRQPDTA